MLRENYFMDLLNHSFYLSKAIRRKYFCSSALTEEEDKVENTLFVAATRSVNGVWANTSSNKNFVFVLEY